MRAWRSCTVSAWTCGGWGQRRLDRGQLDRDHLVAIGPKVLAEISGQDLRAIKQEIKAAPVSSQIEVAKAAAERLARAKEAAKTPGAKRKAAAVGMSVTRAVNALNKVTSAIQERPDLAKDAKVAAAVAALIKVAK